ncbi:hypothetical protein HOP50_15g76230 [Chloropicon primus]|uniref:Ion transport domain-containing protein n=1 Tax=Chloropicon primus TaxID=1764295 RepID=A0A5B8MX48_9CHLO|nr:hypothetical protein A3770_15p75950 [Chloropicon primus]UPR04286.1 hypothetical protein HOP50_15g76230 [Chloropicon primus]|eukprot:QDZ25077.1 hypothetical protein A3770_15p75950 [Chloropicon primus]
MSGLTGARHMNLYPPVKIEKVLSILVAAVALGYAVQLGLEVEEGNEDLYYYTNIAVAGVYLLETILNTVLQKKGFFTSPRRYLNILDCCITAVAVLDAVFEILGEEYFLLRFFKVLKVFRVMWVLSFSETFAFALGIFERVGMNFILVLIIEFAVLYCNALLVTKFVGQATEFRSDPVAKKLYGSLTSSLSTLFQLCTFQMAWSESVEHVLDNSSASTGKYVWIIHVECILVFAYLWFVVVMGGIFKALLDEKVQEEQMHGMKTANKLEELRRALLLKNAEALHGDDALSDQEDDEKNPKSVKELQRLEEFAAANELMALSVPEAVRALEFLTDREETVEKFKANAIDALFTLNRGVNKMELYQSSSRMLSKLQQTLRIQREDTEELRHNVSVLSGLLQQNIQVAAKGEKIRVRNQEWFQEREQLKTKNEKLAADIINIKRQLQAAKVEAAAARSTMGQKVKAPTQTGIY